MPDLPPVPAPRGRYVPAVAHAGMVVTAGMTPRRDGALVWRGAVGDELGLDEAVDAAGLAATNALAAAAHAAGGVERLTRLVSLTVYVACGEGFRALSAVADGASAALAAALGTTGRAAAARAAVGVRALPDGAPVEVQLTAAFDPASGAALGQGHEPGHGHGETREEGDR